MRCRHLFALVLSACLAPIALAAQQPSAPAADDPLSGDWNAVAFYDQEVLFSLSLKVEGSAVTGTVSTSEGSQELKSGRWEEGTFSFETSYQGGPVAMKATIKDGKLVGDWVYNGGEAAGRWEASRKPKA